ncbi:TetR/AcrR family transcriptional regulator [Agitococcus lubricus]|uniref:TetR family transcriptional regulator n=1 Tax=Agitococcus lubricus TaxID=1077255 RepID=A0A2T5IYK1_9GAMM|nr:TetR/AcrR family transcriptional regulator [Agitococcus lubricus]PTQ89045.1 TetR family transcriptional regulator [Agitococcus lubricus]
MINDNHKLTWPCCPATSRGEQRRDAFLQAARAIFLEKGYAGTSIDEVVQRTGGSKASVYKYFGSKEGLFAAMFAERCQAFLAQLEIPNDVSDDLEQTLTHFAQRVLSASVDAERIAMIRALASEAARFPDLAHMAYNTGPKYGLGLLADFLERHHHAGVIDCPHPHIAAIQFMEMIKGHVQWRALLGLSPFPEHIDRDDYVKDAVRTFLRGYQA